MERREPRANIDDRRLLVNGQQLTVSPEIPLPSRYRFSGDLYGVEIVGDFKRPETFLAGVYQNFGVLGATFPADQPLHVAFECLYPLMIPRETLFLYLIISCKNYSVGNISNSTLSIPFNKNILK
jgi:hypothetical protein